jgi:hypothetical protein
MARGRPPQIIQEEKPTKFERLYNNYDGTTEVWKFDLEKQPNGPIEVNVVYDKSTLKELKSKEKKEELDQSKLPKSKRKYIHPKTGKEIGYTRAYNLGIIK